MSSMSIVKRMKANIKPGDRYWRYVDHTRKWHEMVVTDVVPPRLGKELFYYQDKRHTTVIMIYLEDCQNTRMFFYKKDIMNDDNFVPADSEWNRIED